MIGFQNCSKYFYTPDGVRIILHDATLTFGENQNIVVLAHSGAGKSTVIRMLAGIEAPSAGTIMRATGLSWPIGNSSIFQPYLTAEENVRIVANLSGVDAEWTSAFVHDFSELGSAYFETLVSYSSSMRGQLGFALSMALPVDMYLADQGLGVGSARYRDKCEAMILQRLEKTSLFMVTSNIKLAERYGDRIIVLRDGGFIECGTIDEAQALLGERQDEYNEIEDLIAAFREG
jgi:capsular polysaccharide transport system ATP-binding protein